MANLPAPELRRAVADIEAMGFGTIWIGEAIGREALAAAALILLLVGIHNSWDSVIYIAIDRPKEQG